MPSSRIRMVMELGDEVWAIAIVRDDGRDREERTARHDEREGDCERQQEDHQESQPSLSQRRDSLGREREREENQGSRRLSVALGPEGDFGCR